MKSASAFLFLLLSKSTGALSLHPTQNNKSASRPSPRQPIGPSTAAPRMSPPLQQSDDDSKVANRSITTCWIVLISSILLECLDTSFSKLSREMASTPLFFMACSLNLISMYGMNISMTRIPVSVAYTVWTALGTLVVTLLGACLFHEPIGWSQALCLTMITAGVIGLNLQTE